MLTAAKVAALLGLSARFVYDLAARGDLVAHRFGGAVRFDPADVEAYRVIADGQPWRVCGWSAALAGLRKAYQRLPSPRSDFWRD